MLFLAPNRFLLSAWWPGNIDGLALSFIQIGVQIVFKHRPGPSVFNRLLNVEERLLGIVSTFGEKEKNMPPGDRRNLRSNLLRNFLFGVQFLELAHGEKISGGEAFSYSRLSLTGSR